MTKQQELATTNIKPYYMILLSCLLCTLLMLNSNYVNEQRAKEKLNQERKEFFGKIMSLRKLESNTENQSYSQKVCSGASDKLNQYYETGEISLIGLEDGPIKCKDKDADYMKALRALAKNLIGGDDNESGSDNTRNLEEEDSNLDNIITYAKSRVLPMVIFLTIGILSIFGWIGCCVFCCYDCCCCCCCKKPECKIPCFIFSYVFYALVVGVSIYGLTQSNKIFTGLYDTECSLLKFFDQVIDGEIKQELPRWAGINGINNILDNLKITINTMGNDTYNELVNKINAVETGKTPFINKMHSIGNELLDSSHPSGYKSNYITKDFTGYPNIKSDEEAIKITPKNFYVLDLVKQFGQYDSGSKKYTDNSVLYSWNLEFSMIANEADGYLDTSKDSFGDVLNENLVPVSNALDDAKSKLSEIREPFDDVNEEIGKSVADYSEDIDKYGKLVVKLVFSILMVMNIALAAFMTLIGLFSMKACVDCCFCRCIFKSLVHILWNILALMMVLSFVVGSILSLVGRVGDDAMNLFSYIFSEDNFNDANPLFLDRMGDGERYIRRCFLQDGDISAELNIGNQIGSFDKISGIERNISVVYNQFSSIISNVPTYNIFKDLLKSRENSSSDFYLIPSKNEGIENPPFSFDKLIESFNEKIGSVYPDNKDSWSREGENINCPNGSPSGKDNLNIAKCDPSEKYSSLDIDVMKYATMIHDSLGLVKNANDATLTNPSTGKSLINLLDELAAPYKEYLKGYTNVLQFVQGQIGKIMNITRDYTQEGNAFSFLNGKFIKTNLNIMLKYLENSLGNDLYTVGICLILVGCSLILSISSTILLDVIINLELKKNMNPGTTGPVPTPRGPEVVISSYQVNDPNAAAATVQY